MERRPTAGLARFPRSSPVLFYPCYRCNPWSDFRHAHSRPAVGLGTNGEVPAYDSPWPTHLGGSFLMGKALQQEFIEKWKISDAAEMYGIGQWGKGYFAINKLGHVTV